MLKTLSEIPQTLFAVFAIFIQNLDTMTSCYNFKIFHLYFCITLDTQVAQISIRYVQYTKPIRSSLEPNLVYIWFSVRFLLRFFERLQSVYKWTYKTNRKPLKITNSITIRKKQKNNKRSNPSNIYVQKTSFYKKTLDCKHF